jgi:Holliday junction DNA helicase RuvA
VIGYLEGQILKIEEDRILLLVSHVGYEVLLPAFVMETLSGKSIGDTVSFFIYHHQTERQPKPVLIGFNLEAEREFFRHFISVEAIGPMKAVKALELSVREIAIAIENEDIGRLKNLKGIGSRTAQKIIATLRGKVEKFAMIRKGEAPAQVSVKDFSNQVLEVLVSQLGHRKAEATRMINEAMGRNPSISSAEALFDEVYLGEKNR